MYNATTIAPNRARERHGGKRLVQLYEVEHAVWQVAVRSPRHKRQVLVDDDG